MRKFLIVASEKDLASMNIANNIINTNNFIEIESFEKGRLYKKDGLLLTIIQQLGETETSQFVNAYKASNVTLGDIPLTKVIIISTFLPLRNPKFCTIFEILSAWSLFSAHILIKFGSFSEN